MELLLLSVHSVKQSISTFRIVLLLGALESNTRFMIQDCPGTGGLQQDPRSGRAHVRHAGNYQAGNLEHPSVYPILRQNNHFCHQR